MRFLLTGLLLTLLTTGCGEKSRPPIHLNPTSYSQLSNWAQSDHSGALTAFTRSCDIWKKRAKNKQVGCNSLALNVQDWQNICATASAIDTEYSNDIRHFFEQQFTPYHVSIGRRDDGLFTGYYIPEIRGALKRGGPYQTPVYGKPSDLQKGKEYYSRAEIYDGKLKGRGLEIAWVADPVQLFFIEIQGSGVIRLAEGGATQYWLCSKEQS